MILPPRDEMPSARELPYTKDDKVRVKEHGKVGVVTYAYTSGEFVQVTLTGEGFHLFHVDEIEPA